MFANKFVNWCNKYGLAASYKGCEKYKQLKERIIMKRKNLTENKSINTNVYTNPETSFANVIRGSNNPLNKNTNTLDSSLNNTLLQEIKNFMININTQILNLQKQLNLQVSRIDTIFSIVEA